MKHSIPITLRPNVLVDTGRASYGDVIHQLPRNGGVRDCIVARDRQVLASCDYGGLELATHSQNCIYTVGYSRLGEALNAGIKVHDALAATFLGVTYGEFARGMKEEFVASNGRKLNPKICKAIRQAVKPANFGFPGGMGAVKLVLQQRKQGPDTTAPDGKTYKGLRFCVLAGAHACGLKKVTEWKRKPITPTCEACIQVAEDIRNVWFRQWPENEPYFEYVTDCVDNGQMVERDGIRFRLRPAQIKQHSSGRLRGGVEFCSCANGFFQGLAGDGAKRALTRACREMYDGTYRLPDGSRSPLYGCRTILFAHDELIVEGPEETAHLWAERLSVLMVESMREYTPDVVVEAPAAISKRWYKAMEPVIHLIPGFGRGLVPWTPEHIEKECEQCAAAKAA